MVVFRVFSFGFVFLSVILMLTVRPLAESSDSPWFKPDPPTVKTIEESVNFNQLPLYENRDCLPETKFIVLPHRGLQQESSQKGCAIRSSFGLQNITTGDIQLDETSIAGSVKSYEETSRPVEIIPGSNSVFYTGGGLYGARLYLIKDFTKKSKVVVNPDGSIYHKFDENVLGEPIKNKSGDIPEFTDMRFSANGKWMIGEIPFYGMARVNLETGDFLQFGPGYNHAAGRPHFISAISSDGRYAAVTERERSIFTVYDLSDCSSGCACVNFIDKVREKISNFDSVIHVQFSGDNSLRFYARYSNHYGQFLITASGQNESLIEYMATGDSFSSGEGAYNYKTDTDVRHPSNKCHLSLISFPYLTAKAVGLNSNQSVACSGAMLKDIYSDENEYRTKAWQSEGKSDQSFDPEIYTNFFPGYRTQQSFIEKYKPQIVTTTVGGNDIGFGKILLSCIMPGNCYDTPQEKLDLFYTINSKFGSLVETYSELKNSSASAAKIYVLGYPSLATEGSCALNVHLSNNEIIFSNQLVSYINSVIKAAAEKAGAVYVDTEKAFYGSRLCETDSSKIAVNGLTAGDDKTASIPLVFNEHDLELYLAGHESYHPNKLGNELLSKSLLAATNSLALSSPDPSISINNPSNETAYEKSGATEGSIPHKIIYQQILENSLFVKGKTAKLHIANLRESSGADIRLKQGAQLGSFSTSSSGELDLELSIPGETTPGLYILEVKSQNTAGEYISLQQLIYIAESEDDFDGDGVLNKDESCLLAIDQSSDSCSHNPPLVSISVDAQTSPQDNIMLGSTVTNPKVLSVSKTSEPVIEIAQDATSVALTYPNQTDQPSSVLSASAKTKQSMAAKTNKPVKLFWLTFLIVPISIYAVKKWRNNQ